MFAMQKSAKVQLRVDISDYKGRKFINLRDWILQPDGEYTPTKKGVTVPPELIDELIDNLKKLKSRTATQIHQVDSPLNAFAIAKSGTDVVFAKKHIYARIESAKGKTPPDGYGLYSVLVKKGVVVKHKLLFRRKSNKWIEVKK